MPFPAETSNTQKRKLSQKRKTLVSDDILLEPQISDPRYYLLPSLQSKNTTHLKHAPSNGLSHQGSVAHRCQGHQVWGEKVHTCHTSSQTPQQRERLSLCPWKPFTCSSAFWSGPHFFIQPAMCQALCQVQGWSHQICQGPSGLGI